MTATSTTAGDLSPRGRATETEEVMAVKLCSVADAEAITRFYTENEAHLMPWEPGRPPGFHGRRAWAERLRYREQEQREGRGYYFLGVDTRSGAVIATCSLTGVARGPLDACYMGYSVDHRYEGQGYMKQLCLHVIDYAFHKLHLHRIMANYMPHNDRSGGLLKHLGFEKEGYAKQYLRINGRWEDHVLTALINPRDRD
ncbi:GNAT family N-acetyltransferase [Gilvimarinus sp. F26214L]|uniref:GNAT family N-acetyltransferase n=1 Tax=Gilvimarinus sp. DZF01 TaxID=3461371 RepID=UPI004045D26F